MSASQDMGKIQYKIQYSAHSFIGPDMDTEIILNLSLARPQSDLEETRNLDLSLSFLE